MPIFAVPQTRPPRLRQRPEDQEVGDGQIEQRRDEESGHERRIAPKTMKPIAALRLDPAVEQVEVDEQARRRDGQEDERDRRDRTVR